VGAAELSDVLKRWQDTSSGTAALTIVVDDGGEITLTAAKADALISALSGTTGTGGPRELERWLEPWRSTTGLDVGATVVLRDEDERVVPIADGYLDDLTTFLNSRLLLEEAGRRAVDRLARWKPGHRVRVTTDSLLAGCTGTVSQVRPVLPRTPFDDVAFSYDVRLDHDGGVPGTFSGDQLEPAN
jgi:hypothetical protein